MAYNYVESMVEDVKTYINDCEDREDWTNDRRGLEEKLNDELLDDDSVTGNGSGSYTFNSYKAREYVLDNMDIYNDMISEYGISAETVAEDFENENWEKMDVCIRCYLLGQAINEALDGLESEGYFDEEEEEVEQDHAEQIAKEA